MPTSPHLRVLVMALAAAASSAGAQQGHHHAPEAHRHSAASAPTLSPYAAEAQRPIKALSADEQRAWLEGQGAGMARAAELNRHPGPLHVLELSAALELTAEQSRLTRALMDRHQAEVRALGRELVDLEIELDRLFAQGPPVDPGDVARLAEAIGVRAGRIRSSHLRTHVAQTALLTAEQVRRYQVLRGYAR
jgi:hypothetical protein